MADFTLQNYLNSSMLWYTWIVHSFVFVLPLFPLHRYIAFDYIFTYWQTFGSGEYRYLKQDCEECLYVFVWYVSDFSHYWIKKKSNRRIDCMLAHNPLCWRRHGNRSLEQLVTVCPQAGRRERWILMGNTFSMSFFIPSWTTAHRMVLSPFQLGLPSSVKLPWKCSDRHAQR